MEAEAVEPSFQLQPLQLFLAMYIAVYLASYLLLFRGWHPDTRPEASSCAISLLHGTPAVALSLYTLLSDPSRDFNAPNSRSQDLVLDYSVAYFLTDLLHYLVFYPRDILFIAHHLATLYMLLTCRYLVRHGSYAILVLLVMAEVTSACQNIWTLARMRRRDVALARRLYDSLCPWFYGMYTVVRGVCAPVFVYRMGSYFVGQEGKDGGVVVATWVWTSWLSVVAVAILVSMSWVYVRWMELWEETSTRSEAKVK